MKENHPKPKPNKRLLEKMIQNRARKQQQDRAGEDGRRPGEPILFQVGQRLLLVMVRGLEELGGQKGLNSRDVCDFGFTLQCTAGERKLILNTGVESN